MAEPQPSSTHEGADIDDNEAPAILKSAEDRKAAAALSSLDARNDEDSASTSKPQVDQEALGKAMKNLEIAGSAKKGTGKTVKKEEKKAVKVDQADVALLVCCLEFACYRVRDWVGKGGLIFLGRSMNWI